MPIPNVKSPPPPPRRVPPAASLAPDVSAGTYIATHLEMKLSGVAVTSQQLIQTKDAVNDIKMALATAEDTIQRTTTNPALLGSSAGDSTRGGVDIQSLQFATATREKLAAQEQKQDAHYATLREFDSVGHEVQKASRDPSLLRYREEAECQLASSAFPGARFPRSQGGSSASPSSRPIPPEERQALLNPFTTVRRQSKSSALTTSGVFTNNNSSSNVSSGTAPFRPSAGSSINGGGATAPPESHPHASNGVPTLYGGHSNNSSGSAGGGGDASGPPVTIAGGRYRPGPPSSSPPMSQAYGGAYGTQGGYPGAPAYPPTVTPATMGGGGYPAPGGAGYYGASPYPPQGQPRPVYGQYGQQPPMPSTQANGRPTYTAL